MIHARPVAALAAATLAAGLAFASAAPAFAEDTAPADAPTTATVTPDPTPVVVEEPTAPAADPVAAAPEPAPTAPADTPAPTPEVAAAVAPTVGPATVTLKWIMPKGGTATNVTWPQPTYTDANLAAIPCSETRTIQIDTYRYVTAEDVNGVDALDDDGKLDNGEDHPYVISWSFETYTAPACAPAPCTVTGGSYTESDDAAPVATVDGLQFTAPGAKAVGYRYPTSGNAQGWTSQSFTATDTAQFFYRLTFDLSGDGGPAYKSASFGGQTTITAASVPDQSFWGGKSIAEIGAAYPHNRITSVGWQTNSGAPVGYTSTLSATTGGCGTVSFVPPPVDTRTPVTPQTPTVLDLCGVTNDEPGLPGEPNLNEDGSPQGGTNDGVFRYLLNSYRTDDTGIHFTVYAQLIDRTAHTIAAGAGYHVDPEANAGDDTLFFDGEFSSTNEVCATTPPSSTPSSPEPAAHIVAVGHLALTGDHGEVRDFRAMLATVVAPLAAAVILLAILVLVLDRRRRATR